MDRINRWLFLFCSFLTSCTHGLWPSSFFPWAKKKKSLQNFQTKALMSLPFMSDHGWSSALHINTKFWSFVKKSAITIVIIISTDRWWRAYSMPSMIFRQKYPINKRNKVLVLNNTYIPMGGNKLIYHMQDSGCCSTSDTKSCPTLQWPHGLQPARPLCLWDSPGKNTGVGCHFLL